MVGQELEVLNSDDLLHNVHSLSEINRPFNRAMPGAIKRASFSFTDEEPAFRIKCDVHPWMSTYLGVFSHPYFRRHPGPTVRSRSPACPPAPTRSRRGTNALGTPEVPPSPCSTDLTGMVDLTFALPE